MQSVISKIVQQYKIIVDLRFVVLNQKTHINLKDKRQE